ncbi:MAG: alpha/beta fold hydrolase [Deltaproteobacteria bacterium]|nr:alpha/beta fold hydrolase [Deltaproteobacteria bacterium]
MPQVLPHYEVLPGRGPHLLLVHGMLSSRSQWRPNLPALSRVCRPVVLELYGHGRSPAPDAVEAYHPDRYVDAFERIGDQIGAERWFVLGQSLGAALTLRYALAHPERVIAQLLTNTSSAFSPPEWGRDLEPAMRALQSAVSEHGAAAVERMPIHPRQARRLAPEIKAALVADAAEHDPQGIAFSGRGTVVHAALGHRLRENRVPALLACGTHEKRFTPLRDRAARHMPLLEIEDMDGGHSVNLDAPAEFDRAAVRFIARHVRA